MESGNTSLMYASTAGPAAGSSSSSSSSSSTTSIIRKINEHPKLRMFLSSNFDTQAYTRQVILEGKADDCLHDVDQCMTEVNDEIKSYISQHKDTLMNGMQDVTVLSDRYKSLSKTSKKVTSSITSLKKQVLDSYDNIKNQAAHLEAMHNTSLILRQLRQFVYAKNQLDHHLKVENIATTTTTTATTSTVTTSTSGSNTSSASASASTSLDIRNLATAAKFLNELEHLLASTTLANITYVKDLSYAVHKFGELLRYSAQEQLLSSLKDRNQASIGSILQIFFNLESLPEIILFGIDKTVKVTMERSNVSLDFDNLINTFPELSSSSSSSSSLSKLSSVNIAAAGGNQELQSQVTSSQLRSSLRDLAASWAGHIYEHALQIQVMQRVIMKKEDPASHKKFSDILKSVVITVDNTSNANVLLSNSKLLQLYWDRLSVSLQDLIAIKLKKYPLAATRLYPYLRNAAIATVNNLNGLADKDLARDTTSFFSSTIGYSSPSDGSMFTQAVTDGMFGSMTWSQSIGIGSILRSSNSSSSRSNNNQSVSSMNESVSHTVDTGLLIGLKPLKDRFLLSTLTRMNAPILQMFPEIEGYTAAVPSKRDMQTLMKAIHSELVAVAIEGERGLIKAVCKEAFKAIQLMVTKVESLSINSVETKKIINSQNGFIKTSQQEHNSQLTTLLLQLRESIERLPYMITKSAKEAPSSLLTSSCSIDGTDGVDTEGVILQDMSLDIVYVALELIDETASKQLIAPVIETMISYVKSALILLCKESSSSSNSNECSRVVQLLVKQIPEIIKVYLYSMNTTKSSSVLINDAVEELCIRTMNAYVSVACLTRPMNEQSRLRIASDMTALEMMVSTISAMTDTKICPVYQEFNAFRRLLFIQSDTETASGTGSCSSSSSSSSSIPPPTRQKLQAMPFYSHLRRSVILSYLVACSPAQMPIPYDHDGTNISSYLDAMTYVSQHSSSIREQYSASSSSSSDGEVWELVRRSLDIYLQRIAVLPTSEATKCGRLYYELILEIGGASNV